LIIKSTKITEYKFNPSRIENFPDIYQLNYIGSPDVLHSNIPDDEPFSSSEGGETMWVSQYEKNIVARWDSGCLSCVNWGLALTISLHLALIFILLACFLRTDFLNVCI